MRDAAIRLARPGDAELLSRLGWKTFLDTFVRGFAMPYPPEDLESFFAASYAPERFAAALADPASRAWIAEQGGEAVGFATAGPAGLPHPDVAAQDGELKRLYLREAAKGSGLAARLMDGALAWLDRDRERTLWLGVWSGNLRAQRFYARYGFETAGEYRFAVGATLDHEFIMRRPPAAARLAP